MLTAFANIDSFCVFLLQQQVFFCYSESRNMSHPYFDNDRKRDTMNYIIFDLEWNQPMDERAAIQEPFYLSGEIIEIGAVKLDDGFRVADELKLYIRPKYYTKLHKRIISLTGIRDQVLQKQGMPFPEAMEKFTAWCGEEYAYMTWSMSDMPMLIDNMLLHGMDVSDLPACYDIQRIFGREIMREGKRCSLDHALEILNEKGDTAHDALHDARNTAIVCSHLELAEYICEYTSRVFAEEPKGVRYETAKQVLGDERLRTFDCPWCGNPVQCEPWISYERGTWITCGRCAEEDEFVVLLEIVKHPGGEYSAKRLMFEMSDDWWDIYMDKREMA